uniref:Piwi domain-containing protein n=1 Tax=Globisporangium ultimum (strain ATCC 200006 / CBS 805.95 / DAOM BR144) TaxID=431595 RepID=K3X5M0_GLOUD
MHRRNCFTGSDGLYLPYYVVLDEIGFTADKIQETTCKLVCYTLTVPSAYYSHLVAFRARSSQLEGSGTSSMQSGSGESGYEVDTRMLEIHDYHKQVMFYV